MADVFISYARADQQFAERLVSTLRSLGLDVWFDRYLKTGEDWELEIERQLDKAKSVIVLWSKDSVESLPVRAEARRALKRRKLLPIAIEDVEPPLFSSGIQLEKLDDWRGETSAIEFQDLYAQIVSLTQGQAASQLVPRDGETALTKETAEEEHAPMLSLPWLHRPVGPFRSAASLLWSLFAFAFTVTMAIYREEFFGPYWEGVFILAGAALALFLIAERELAPNVKAMVARWLRPQPDAKPIRSIDAFLALFEGVFGKRHLSFRCLWASAFASVALYAALLFLFIPFDVLEPLALQLWNEGPKTPEAVKVVGVSYVSTGFLEQNAALLFLAVPVANILVDYFSLWQTRSILGWSSRGLPLGLGVLLDAVLTALIFVALLPLGPVAFVLGLEMASGGLPAVQAAIGESGQAFRVAKEIWRSLWVFVTVGWPGEFLSAIAAEANVPNTAILIAFFTTFTTSVWLWFALLFAPFVRFLSWTRRRGLSWLGMAVNTSKRPIAPLGYAAAGLILMIGAGTSEIAGTLAEKTVKTDPMPLAVFRDCEECPEMVMLPGGRFTMGSPEDEKGREPYKKGLGIEEGPETEVSIAPFAIGRYEITFREWDRCAFDLSVPENQRCRAIPRGQQRFSQEHDSGVFELAFGDQGWGRGLRPVVTVSWEDVQVYIAWLNAKVKDKGIAYRLPSEAEWEYAARAGTNGPYSFDGDIDQVGCSFENGGDRSAGRANTQLAEFYLSCDDGYAFTAPVGAYQANPLGLHDMHGNVREWVRDCLHNSYEGRPVTAEPWMDNCDLDNSAVLRGGSWFYAAELLRSASRGGDRRFNRYVVVGVRLARTARE